MTAARGPRPPTPYSPETAASLAAGKKQTLTCPAAPDPRPLPYALQPLLQILHAEVALPVVSLHFPDEETEDPRNRAPGSLASLGGGSGGVVSRRLASGTLGLDHVPLGLFVDAGGKCVELN